MSNQTGSRCSDEIQVTISIDKLRELFAQGAICVADIGLVNPEAKKLLWGLCLECCVTNTDCHKSAASEQLDSTTSHINSSEVIARCGTTTCLGK